MLLNIIPTVHKYHEGCKQNVSLILLRKGTTIESFCRTMLKLKILHMPSKDKNITHSFAARTASVVFLVRYTILLSW